MIKLDQYLTASGKYPNRRNHPEILAIQFVNAKDLLDRVNALLIELGLNPDSYSISSGFRPSDVNQALANAAKASLHQECKAIDIVDDSKQTLAKLIEKRPELLKKHGLWLESPKSTIGKNSNWVHLDTSTARKDREIRIFNP